MSDQRTKEQIFKEAAILFAEKGYNGVSVREICECSNISKPTLYYYFGSKEGVYKALVDAGTKLGSERIQEIIDKKAPVKEKLVDVVKFAFSNTIKHPELVKFSQTLLIQSESLPFLEDFVATANNRRLLLSELIDLGIKSGEFGASASPHLACEVVVGTMTHFVWKQLNSSHRILSDQLAEDIVELLFKGLNE